MIYSHIRRLLFRLDPERVHNLTLRVMYLAGIVGPVRRALQSVFAAPARPVDVFGLHFKNPVGLAAGYDKDGLAWRGLACLGFGHIEVGTVTPQPQSGNPRPRVFRLSDSQALINRMGFPGLGAEAVLPRLQGTRRRDVVLGVNIGKNKDTSLDSAVEDYLSLMRRFAPVADYLAVNVSSPNTVGLRRLQARTLLDGLLAALAQERKSLEMHLDKRIPLLVKLAPDLSDQELADALDVIISRRLDGVIATNTTISREGLTANGPAAASLAVERGGLSGAPLTRRSTTMIRKITHLTGGTLPVIGVGGVMTPRDAQEKLDAGATLVQVYTGLVYSGPGLVNRIVSGLSG